MAVFKNHGLERVRYDDWLLDGRGTAQEYLADKGAKGDPSSLFQEHVLAMDEVRKSGIRPTIYPDTEKFLKTIHESGRPIVIISSHPEEHLKMEAKEYQIDQYVEQFIGNAIDKAMEIKNVCKEYGVSEEAAVYIGDTINDIRAAKKAGVVSIGVATGYHAKEKLLREEPSLLMDSLSDLLVCFDI